MFLFCIIKFNIEKIDFIVDNKTKLIIIQFTKIMFIY